MYLPASQKTGAIGSRPSPEGPEISIYYILAPIVAARNVDTSIALGLHTLVKNLVVFDYIRLLEALDRYLSCSQNPEYVNFVITVFNFNHEYSLQRLCSFCCSYLSIMFLVGWSCFNSFSFLDIISLIFPCWSFLMGCIL